MTDFSLTDLKRYLLDHPDSALHWNELGMYYFEKYRDVPVAMVCFEKSISLDPDCPYYRANLGIALLQTPHLQRSRALLATAAAALPEDLALQNNLAGIEIEAGDIEAARARLDHLLETHPEDARLRYNRAYIALYDRDYRTGFAGYESRLTLTRPRPLPDRLWQGEDLNGKRLCCLTEQGIGDLFQMLRYMSVLKSRYQVTLILEVFPGLESLVQAQSDVDEVITLKTGPFTYTDYDYCLPYLSLPHRLAEQWDTVTARIPYLTVPPTAQHALADLFPKTHNKPRIGLVWEGKSNYKRQHFRRLPTDALFALTRDTRFDWYALQKGPGESRIESDVHPLVHLGPCLTDWSATSFALQQLDLLISCDTGIVHLAGALGLPVWVAISAIPEWRWSHTLLTSPWYPTLRLFRQSELGQWDAPMNAIKEALNEFLLAY